MNEHKLARFLGWFSLGLGLTEVVAPGRLARFLGAENRPTLVRSAYGLRELAAGAGLLMRRNPTPWLWARVAGDALDLATLGAVLGRPQSRRRNVMLALASVVGVTALDVWAGQRFTRR